MTKGDFGVVHDTDSAVTVCFQGFLEEVDTRIDKWWTVM